jgi:hypothetical protein
LSTFKGGNVRPATSRVPRPLALVAEPDEAGEGSGIVAREEHFE